MKMKNKKVVFESFVVTRPVDKDYNSFPHMGNFITIKQVSAYSPVTTWVARLDGKVCVS